MEKTLTALDQHLGGVDNDEAISACVDNIGRSLFQLIEKMEKKTLTVYAKYVKGSQSHTNHQRPKHITNFSNQSSKHYLKQPYKRFYSSKENSTDVLWTKLNRAVALLDKGFRNTSTTKNNMKHLSRKQQLQDAFITWKLDTLDANQIDYRYQEPIYENIRDHSRRELYEPPLEVSRSFSAYRVQPDINDALKSKSKVFRQSFEDNQNNYFQSNSGPETENKRINDSDGMSFSASNNSYIKTRDSFIQQQESRLKPTPIPQRRGTQIPMQYSEPQELEDDAKSDRSENSYNPDVFFLEDGSLPKSTQALRDRLLSVQNINPSFLPQESSEPHEQAERSTSLKSIFPTMSANDEHLEDQEFTNFNQSSNYVSDSGSEFSHQTAMSRKTSIKDNRGSVYYQPVETTKRSHSFIESYGKPLERPKVSPRRQTVFVGTSKPVGRGDDLADAFELSP